jgi:competence ComEA-like helix-hairpin-helix protein
MSDTTHKNLKVAETVPAKNLISVTSSGFDTTIGLATRKKTRLQNAQVEVSGAAANPAPSPPQDAGQKTLHPTTIYKLAPKTSSPSSFSPQSAPLLSSPSFPRSYEAPKIPDSQELRKPSSGKNNHITRKISNHDNPHAGRTASFGKKRAGVIGISVGSILSGVLFLGAGTLMVIFLLSNKKSSSPHIDSPVEPEAESAGQQQIDRQNIVKETVAAPSNTPANSPVQSIHRPEKEKKQETEDKVVRNPDGKITLIPNDLNTSPANLNPRFKYPVDINTASYEELVKIKGIGPSLATKIIAGRPYHNTRDLLKVKGIGDATYKKIADYLTVQK